VQFDVVAGQREIEIRHGDCGMGNGVRMISQKPAGRPLQDQVR
jgi:hypothetical protein